MIGVNQSHVNLIVWTSERVVFINDLWERTGEYPLQGSKGNLEILHFRESGLIVAHWLQKDE